MGRVNKTIEGVFVNITPKDREISSYDAFINYNSKKMSIKTQKYLLQYKELVEDRKHDFEKLAELEIIILQIKSIENISDIKLSVVRDEYVYARSPFYRKDTTSKDIRVLIENLSIRNKTVEELYNDQNFMSKAKIKLAEAMEKELKESIDLFNHKYQIDEEGNQHDQSL